MLLHSEYQYRVTLPRLCAGLLVAVTAACTEPPPPCRGITSLTVSSGTTPTFRWSQECGVSWLSVSESSVTKWWVIARDTNAILSPVVYAVTPVNADSVAVAPAMLESGHTYTVSLYGHPSGALLGDVFELASATFVP